MPPPRSAPRARRAVGRHPPPRPPCTTPQPPRPAAGTGDDRLHLHGLQMHQRLAGRDALAHRQVHPPDRPGDRRAHHLGADGQIDVRQRGGRRHRRCTRSVGASELARRLPPGALLGEGLTLPLWHWRSASSLMSVEETMVLRQVERRLVDRQLGPADQQVVTQVEQLVGARPDGSGSGRSVAAAMADQARTLWCGATCSTPERCARRTGTHPDPPCRRCTDTPRRCPPRSRASTFEPGCTWW